MEKFGEIIAVSKWLQGILQNKLYPVLLADKDEVQLIVPAEKTMDYKVGIWLYDIKDYSGYNLKEYQVIDDRHRYLPPKAVELSYMITVLEDKQFGGIFMEDTQRILSACIASIYDNSVFMTETAKIAFSFLKLDIDMKIKLWNSISKPLQSAVYVNAAPVLIASERMEEYYLVKKEPEVEVRKR